MSVKFGEIDVSQILENEYRIGVLEGIVDWMLTNNSGFVKNLTPEEMKKIRQRVVERLQQKYPKSGIELRQE
jgi:trans-aconitate methyltransferase